MCYRAENGLNKGGLPYLIDDGIEKTAHIDNVAPKSECS